MKIFLSPVSFNGKTVTSTQNKLKIEEFYDDNNMLSSRLEYDEQDRFVDKKSFDSQGNVTEHQHKSYYIKGEEQGCIETFKNEFQHYVRQSYTRPQGKFIHTVDNFQSISNPGKSYINEFIRDLQGRLVKVISNGVTTILAK